MSCLCSLVFNLNYKAIITARTPGCQQWNPGLICSESINPSSALEDFSPSFFNQAILILPYLIFIIMLVLSLMEWKLSTSRSLTYPRLNISLLQPWTSDLHCHNPCVVFILFCLSWPWRVFVWTVKVVWSVSCSVLVTSSVCVTFVMLHSLMYKSEDILEDWGHFS